MIETECKTPRGRIWIGDSYHENKLEKKRNNGNYSHLRIGLVFGFFALAIIPRAIATYVTIQRTSDKAG